MTYRQWLIYAYECLANTEDYKLAAKILLAHVTGKSKAFLLAFDETQLTEAQQPVLMDLLARRVQGEPIAYIIGERDFWSLTLSVSPATLIPRPDTECLVEQALARLPAGKQQVLDLGTGCGAIALAIAIERPDCWVTGVDKQVDAVLLAQQNADKHQITNTRFLQSDWYDALQGETFQLIVSNPPYIDEYDPHLALGDVRFEPKCALVAKDNGLSDIKHILSQSKQYLLPYGWLLIEHGWQQGEQVRELFREIGLINVKTCNDYGANERVTLGQYAKLT